MRQQQRGDSDVIRVVSNAITTATSTTTTREWHGYEHLYEFREFDETPRHSGVYSCDEVFVEKNSANSLNLPQTLQVNLPDLRSEYDLSGMND